ncbi:alpha/beta hydrolase [Streptomyces sp. NPDC021749]|uniref:alpha/beta hydrolase n=1 Tax=Streptomyces sp. NPDC021749 TaxID=3154905 RepID=UPI00340A9779
MPPAPPKRSAVLCALLALAAVPASTAPAQAHDDAALRFGACPSSVPAPPAPDRVECGHLDVPLDRRKPDGRHIRIAVSRVPASGTPEERRGILLVNPGGPGGSGLPYAVTKRAKLPASVRRAYDVIGFDPRGTGQSAPADCGPMGGLFDAPAPDPAPTDRAAERASHQSLKNMAHDCAAHTGTDTLPHLSTTATAHDMDAVRSALGEDRISYLGVSYGSYLGAAYAAAFPHHIDRMVLDSVVGPWDWYDFDLRQSRALLRQREVFFAWAARYHHRFGLGTDATAVRAAYSRARHHLTVHPQQSFGPAEFDRTVYRSLGRTERWTALADGIAGSLRTGDTTPLHPAEPFAGAASRTYEAANRTVQCADGPGPAPARVRADLRRSRRLDPPPLLTGMEASVCAYWHHRPAHRTLLGSPQAPPVLLIASEHDPVTPLAGARQLARRLPGSRLVTLHHDYSHGVFASRGNPCVDGTAAAYLVDGTVPAKNVHCAGPGLPTP